MAGPRRSTTLLLMTAMAALMNNNQCGAVVDIGGAVDCGSEGEAPSSGSVVDMKLSGCYEGMNVCPLVRGENTNINLTFTSKVDIPRLRVALHGIVLGFPVPFHLSNEDACVNSNLECPIKANVPHSYLAKVPVKPYYPAMPITVKVQLTDPDDGVDLVCQYIQTKLV